MASIAPKSYIDAAKECYALAQEYETVYNSLQSILIEVGGMAGAYNAVDAWTKSYDSRATAMTVTAPYFVKTLQHMGDVLTATAYNWALKEYEANRDPKKGDPPTRPTLPTERAFPPHLVLGIGPSKTKNSDGLECNIPGLYDRVSANVNGGQIPDGDTDKLAKAASKWKTFSTSTPVADASLRVKVTADGLQRAYGSTAKDVPNLVAHLTTLRNCAREIETAALDIAAAVEAHSTGLTKMRKDIDTNFAGVAVGYAIWIAINRIQIKKKTGPFEKPQKSDGKSPNSNKSDEDEFLNLATLYIVPPINTFLTALIGIVFTSTDLNTDNLAKIANLPILLADIGDTGKGSADQGVPRTGLASTIAEREALIKELEAAGTKFDRNNIVQIGRDPSGRVVFLENGNDRAGLQHVLRHSEEFEAKGIAKDEIDEVVVKAVTEGKQVGVSGRDRPVYEVMHNGKIVKVAVTVGGNGFIVGANPVS